MRAIVLTLPLCLLIGCQTEFSLNPSNNLVLPQRPVGDDISVVEGAHPVVRLSQTDYTEAAVRSSVPDTAQLRLFGNAYGGKYSDSLKQSLVEYVDQMVQLLGGSVVEVQKCLEGTGQLTSGLVSLPMSAERARYQGKEAWLFQFTWGFTPADLGHYRCFVMDAATADTLLFITCR